MVKTSSNKTYYGKAPVLDRYDISASAWGVWCGLSSFARWEIRDGVYVRSKPGSCFPSMELLAIRCHMSKRTVQTAIKELVSIGLVEVEKQYGKSGRRKGKGMQTANAYTLYPAGNAPKKLVQDAVKEAEDKEKLLKSMQKWVEEHPLPPR